MQRKLVQILLLVWIGFVTEVSAQSPSKPEMVDTFGRPNCEEISARGTSFAQRILATEGSRGLMITYPKRNERRLATSWFRGILTTFEYYNLENRIEFVIGQERDDGPVSEFWNVPPNASNPELQGEPWKFPPRDISKPFLYGGDDDLGICPHFEARTFAEFLRNHPGSRAHIVVRVDRRSIFRSHGGAADPWIEELTRTYHIARNRIRAYYVRSNDDSIPYTEFWFVPARSPRRKSHETSSSTFRAYYR